MKLALYMNISNSEWDVFLQFLETFLGCLVYYLTEIRPIWKYVYDTIGVFVSCWTFWNFRIDFWPITNFALSWKLKPTFCFSGGQLLRPLVLLCLWSYSNQIVLDQGGRGIYGIRGICLLLWILYLCTWTQICMDASMHACILARMHAHYFLACTAHISAKFGQIWDIKVSLESEEHASHV